MKTAALALQSLGQALTWTPKVRKTMAFVAVLMG